MAIPLSYCLFMLTCFGAKQAPNPASLCPVDCICYDAPSNGNNGTDAVSLICKYPQSRLPFSSTIINTLVYENQFQDEPNDFFPANPYHVMSLVLKNFNVPTFTFNSLFAGFSKSLKYLSTFNTQLDSQFWILAARFASIEAIHIEDSLLPTLGDAFSNSILRRLNRLTIKSSSLRYIDFPAFSIGKESLRMLELSENQLTSLLWLTNPRVNLTNLWLLDMQSNRLSHLPVDLKQHLPAVKMLRLGGNRFLYFDFAALWPWFGIDEVSLYKLNLENDGNNKLVYTQEMNWLKTFNASAVKANFLVSSFAEGFYYECQGKPLAVDWATFQNECSEMYEVLPNHLYFNNEHKLALNSVNQKSAVSITGIDVDHLSGTSLDLDKLYTLKSHLVHLSSSENAIRIRLFSRQMLRGLIEKPYRLNDSFSAWKADLLVERVAAFLDEAASTGKYVLLVMWTYEDVLENVNDLLQIDWQALEELLLAPLFTRLRHQRALIGIEVISNFLSGEFRSSTKESLLDEGACILNTELQNSIAPKMNFLTLNILSMSRFLGSGKAIGVSIPASCYLCLPLVTLPSCFDPLIDVKWLDFISIISYLEEVENEVYSHVNWQSNVYSGSLPPLFYVFREGENELNYVKRLLAVASVQQYTSGFFTEYSISGSSWDWFPGKSQEKVSFSDWSHFLWK